VEDARLALEHGAEGIGLLRTEFLFLNRSQAPDEETQFNAYRSILELMGDRPVVVRTLDVGGDKEVPYFDFGQEANPFLGYRAIRISLDDPQGFKVQLRALLRAGAGHDLRIMFPMISSIGEVLEAKSLVREAQKELQAANQQMAEDPQIGIMVEIPSVVLLADRFAREVDFFSIGTNDLTQYTLAAERGNSRVSRLNDPCHPAVLKEIQQTVQAAHRAGIWVGVCGEMAGDPQCIPILVGLGVDELSMASRQSPMAKQLIRNWSLKDTQSLARQVLELDTAEAIRRAVGEFPPLSR
jgi:phosphoenolpyruvate-protein phosphotransferase